jgi:predicted secreted protein
MLVLSAAAACTPQATLEPISQTGQKPLPAPKIVGLADNGATMMLKPGQLLQIELEGTPTAGYVWQLSPLPAGATLVSQTSRPSNPQGRAAGMVGGNDWSVFTIQSESATAVSIELVYGRPWELQAGAAPERRFTVRVSAASR